MRVRGGQRLRRPRPPSSWPRSKARSQSSSRRRRRPRIGTCAWRPTSRTSRSARARIRSTPSSTRQLSVRKLEDAFGAHGLEAIKSVGARFDPKLHEAVGHEESLEHPEDTVVAELRRGYRIRDRVVRPALVKLARRPELPTDGPPNPEET